MICIVAGTIFEVVGWQFADVLPVTIATSAATLPSLLKPRSESSSKTGNDSTHRDNHAACHYEDIATSVGRDETAQGEADEGRVQASIQGSEGTTALLELD